MCDDRADFDDVAWDRNDEAWAQSRIFFVRRSTLSKLEALVTEQLKKPACWIPQMVIGGYNYLYKMRLDESSDDVVVRVPQPSISQFPLEKTLREVATARFIAQNTCVPIPRVLSYSLSPDPQLGPYIIMPYIENRGSMSHALAMPNKDPTEAHMLDPNVSEGVLAASYEKVAVHLLHLFKPSFPRIGSLVEPEENVFSVAGRPITQNMNNMLQLANIPHAALPPEDRTYGSADEWYLTLAEMHMAQLVFQHNDLVTTADDCRNKYVARQLFRRLVKYGRLSTFGFAEDDWSAQSKNQVSTLCPAPSGSNSFRLWCDDLRPGNILLNKVGEIAAFIDWEFAYVGPTQFALDPPWWLLLNAPEAWHSGIDHWAGVYGERLKTWLRAMENAEKGVGIDGVTLSVYMRESWETGRFWLNYAARKSWAFDTIFWKYLDQRFFGAREEGIPEKALWKTRIHLLGDKERNAMEPFVKWKMEESKERVLVDWTDEQVQERLAEVLFED